MCLAAHQGDMFSLRRAVKVEPFLLFTRSAFCLDVARLLPVQDLVDFVWTRVREFVCDGSFERRFFFQIVFACGKHALAAVG